MMKMLLFSLMAEGVATKVNHRKSFLQVKNAQGNAPQVHSQTWSSSSSMKSETGSDGVNRTGQESASESTEDGKIKEATSNANYDINGATKLARDEQLIGDAKATSSTSYQKADGNMEVARSNTQEEAAKNFGLQAELKAMDMEQKHVRGIEEKPLPKDLNTLANSSANGNDAANAQLDNAVLAQK